MKKILAFILCFLIVFGMASCKNPHPQIDLPDDTNEPEQEGDEKGDENGGEIFDEDYKPSYPYTDIEPIEKAVKFNYVWLKNLAKLNGFANYDGKYRQFTVFDMNGDGEDDIIVRSGTRTLVLYATHDLQSFAHKNTEYCAHFDVLDNMVGYADVFDIMSDGTFMLKEGNHHSLRGPLGKLCMSENEGTDQARYFILDGADYDARREVTKEEYDEYMESFDTDPLPWYDLTKEAVDHYIPSDAVGGLHKLDLSNYDGLIDAYRNVIEYRIVDKYGPIDWLDYAMFFDIASEEDYALIKAVLISVQSEFYSVDDKNLMAYSLKDISGDGVPEMIVFIEGKSDWLEEGRISIFSKVNGKPVCVASNIEWDIIDGDGRIYSYLQKSEYRSCTVFRLQKDGQSFETIAEFGYEYLSKRYYETVDGERVTISEDKYKKLEKKYCIHPFIVEDNVETMNESFGFGFSYFFDGATGMYPPAKSGK